MAYNYPTEEGIKYAMEQGWSKEQAERGFEIFDFDGTGMLEIEAITDCYLRDNYDDDEASREAERIGYCKIIPIDELPDPFIYGGNSRRFFGWVDTPENRKRIEDYCKNQKKKYKVTINVNANFDIEVYAKNERQACKKALDINNWDYNIHDMADVEYVEQIN
jgi:hypothetical protein